MITVTLYFKSICMACQNNLQSGQTLFQRLPHRLTEKQRSIFMPNLFLSPSVQEYNPYINGLGSEEYYMNLVADAMEPYLISCGISFMRNDPDDTLQQAIALSNAGNYDFHLLLCFNFFHLSFSFSLLDFCCVCILDTLCMSLLVLTSFKSPDCLFPADSNILCNIRYC